MGKGSKAPTGYQPAYQPQADSGYQSLVNNSMPWATALPGQTIPGMTTAANNIANNPYNTGAQQGANLVSSMALGAAPNTMNYYSAMNPPPPSAGSMQPGGMQPGGIQPDAVPMGAQNDTRGMAKMGQFDPSLEQVTQGLHDPPAAAPTGVGGVPLPPTTGAAPMGGGIVGNMYNASGSMYGLGDMASGYAPGAANGAQYGQSAMDAQTAAGMSAYQRGAMLSRGMLNLVPGAMQGLDQASPFYQGGMDRAGAAYDSGTSKATPFYQDAMSRAGPGYDAAMSRAGTSYDDGMSRASDVYGSAMSKATPFFNTGMQHAGQMWDQAQAAIPGLTGGMDAANAVLSNGFDPQGALHDRGYQQMMDRTNAINAMYGVSGSPYGAGVAAQDSRNFDLDWGDRQLSRQISALGAYGTQQGQVASNLTSLMNTGANGYNTLSQGAANGFEGLTNTAVNGYGTLSNNAINGYGTLANSAANGYGTMAGTAANGYGTLENSGVNGYGSLSAGAANGMNTLANGAVDRTATVANTSSTTMNQGVDNLRQGIDSGVNSYNSMMGGAVDRFGHMVNTAQGAYGAGSGQGVDALNAASTATQLPAQTYANQQLQALQAYLALAQGTSAAIAPAQTLTGDQGRYLGIGQGATQLAQNATSINNQNSQAQMAGIGSALGTIAGIALAPATGGLSLFGSAALGGGGRGA